AQNEEIEGLRTRLAALESSAGTADGCCPCNCCPSCCPLATCAGWIGGGDILFLKPHWENNTAVSVLTGPGINASYSNLDFDYDFETAYSVWAGYRGGSGFGVRGRYFEFSHDSSLTFTTGPNQIASAAAPLALATIFGGIPGTTFDLASDL